MAKFIESTKREMYEEIARNEINKLEEELRKKFVETARKYGNQYVYYVDSYIDTFIDIRHETPETFPVDFKISLYIGPFNPIDGISFEIKRNDILKKGLELGIPKDDMEDPIVFDDVARIVAYETVLKNPDVFDKINKALATKIVSIKDAVVGKYRAKLEEVS